MVGVALLVQACSTQPRDEEITEVIKNNCGENAHIAKVGVPGVTSLDDGRYWVTAETQSAFGTQTYTYETESQDGFLVCHGLVRE